VLGNRVIALLLGLVGCSASARVIDSNGDDSSGDNGSGSSESGGTDGCANDCVPQTCPITWEREASGPYHMPLLPSLFGQPLAALSDAVVLVDALGTGDLLVEAWAADGTVAWELKEVGVLDHPPVVLADANGTVFVATSTMSDEFVLRALSGTDGGELWRVELDSAIWFLAHDDHGRVYGLGGYSIVAFDVDSGAPLWSGVADRGLRITVEPGTGRVFGLEFIPENSNTRLVEWVPPAVEPIRFEPFVNEYELAFDAAGRMWGLDMFPAHMHEYDPNGASPIEAIQSIDPSTWGLGTDPGRFVAAARSADGLLVIGVGDVSGFVVSLDGDMQVDCVAHLDGWPDGVAASVDGGFYVARKDGARLVTRFR
jgi:hypothetical protein